MKKNMKWIVWVVIGSLVVVLGIYLKRGYLSAPGCNIPGEISYIGGCFSKHGIVRVINSVPKNCLEVRFFNCLDTGVSFENDCGEILKIEGVDNTDEILLEEGFYNIRGSIRGEKFVLMGYVTKPLCY